MYSGWSPFFRTKFWKKEFVGSGVETRLGEKKLEGSGRTVELVCGKIKGVFFWFPDIVAGRSGSDCDYAGNGGGDGV